AVADPRLDRLAAGRADAAQGYDAASAERARNDRGLTPTTLRRMGIAAASERARNDRALTATRLRRMGIDVVDAEPEDLAPTLADHYLAMKASGKLERQPVGTTSGASATSPVSPARTALRPKWMTYPRKATSAA